MLGLLLSFLFAAGCATADKFGPATVSISGRTLPEIQRTAAAVFAEEGYRPTSAWYQEMVFERPGNTSDALKWGGWSGKGVTMRVRVRITRRENTIYDLAAEVFAVESFESQTRLMNNGPYQKLLQEIARRLQ